MSDSNTQREWVCYRYLHGMTLYVTHLPDDEGRDYGYGNNRDARLMSYTEVLQFGKYMEACDTFSFAFKRR